MNMEIAFFPINNFIPRYIWNASDYAYIKDDLISISIESRVTMIQLD